MSLLRILEEINPLWPNDITWRHKSGSTLAQVMACCLVAPSHYRVSSKSQPQNSSTFQDLFKAFLLNSRPLSTQILSILQKYIYIRDCKIWSIELFHITIHDYDIILSPKRHSDIERGLHLVSTMGQAVANCLMTLSHYQVQWWHMNNQLLKFTDKEIMASYETGVT